MIKWCRRMLNLRTVLIIMTVCSLAFLAFAYLTPFINPGTITLLPLLGLAYWIIISVVIGTLIIWTIMRSRWALIVLLFIVIGGKLHFRTFSFGSDEVNENGTELHVMSYNVRLFDLYNAIRSNSFKTRNKIFNYLKERDPDVVCFQEFYQQDYPSEFVTRDTIKQILSTVDIHERYAFKMNGHQNFGIAVMSKYPIIEKGNVAFPSDHSSANYCIYTDIVKNKDTFRVYNVHLQSIKLQKDDYALFDENNTNSSEQSSNVFRLIQKINRAYPIRAEQAEIIMAHVKNSRHPVIVCGDFNDTPLSYCYNQFNSLLVDAFQNTSKGIGSTYSGKIPVGRIDYIFHSKRIGSKDFVIQKEALSDHYAIDCTVFMKSEE
ncbi:MAG: endonuclease/exonuclease/phosphatase family protein [Crocinitomicaceae bacterium]